MLNLFAVTKLPDLHMMLTQYTASADLFWFPHLSMIMGWAKCHSFTPSQSNYNTIWRELMRTLIGYNNISST